MAQRDVKADGSERSDSSTICGYCLGDNPCVQMSAKEIGKECKICMGSFTVYKWTPGPGSRYEKTETCQTCSKVKDICRDCLLYGLPHSINSNDAILKSEARAIPANGKVRPNVTILKLRRKTTYYKRNGARACSLFLRGECTRGLECSYRHEVPVIGELSQLNISDRYYGVDIELLGKAAKMPSLKPPEDKSIRTLCVCGVDSSVLRQRDLKNLFYTYGEIESIQTVPANACAFFTYTTREGAEKAADELANRLVVNGVRLQLSWFRPVPYNIPVLPLPYRDDPWRMRALLPSQEGTSS